ncbi:MAG: exonuclease SbcCD subunit D C-terminal domain-containing protein [Dysgonamonadaceae bacterium]|jgi:exonuclease SbcD|nr:exonuclease SbcCD subunit D C-terminal domain-containing protein [Dysgonamonadaceae bacterium]
MKLLHTSDWHIGRTLYSKRERADEHAAFLDWLLSVICVQKIDLLLVAGDIFDTSSPSSASQKMYYNFLVKVVNSGCKNIIITGGNHDSPSFLNAPKEILSALNITIMGSATENIEDEVIVINNDSREPVAIVCAVPFLRERDISRFTEGENYSDRSKRIAENIAKHYDKIAEVAVNKRNTTGKNIPVIATGHLSVVGGKTIDDDGVRETYIGNIESVKSDIFPQIFDYVALGHYHIPSVISEKIRYCGSPIPMGFGEAEQKKCVYVVDFENNKTKIETIEIPVFQKLESIVGDKQLISNRLEELKKSASSVWTEIIYTGNEIFPDFAAWVNEQIADTQIDVLKLQNRRYLTEVLTQDENTQSLDELDRFAVFEKLLENNAISDEQKEELKKSYKEIIDELTLEN